jgi:hypothetical protein
MGRSLPHDGIISPIDRRLSMRLALVRESRVGPDWLHAIVCFPPNLRRPRPRSATAGLRRFETSLKRPKCVKSGHSQKAWQRAEIHAKWPPVCFQRRSNALMSTWGMAVVRDFRTAARAAPLAADERPVAVVPHGQPVAVAPRGQPAVAAHGQPAAAAPHGQPVAAAHG